MKRVIRNIQPKNNRYCSFYNSLYSVIRGPREDVKRKQKPVTVTSAVFRREISGALYTDPYTDRLLAPEICKNFALK